MSNDIDRSAASHIHTAACRDRCRGALLGLAVGDALAPKISVIASGSFKDRSPPDIRSSGYVVDALEAALWFFWHARDFR